MIVSHSDEDCVFVNCPFDKDYSNLLKAIVFTIYSCGYYPVSALSEDNALENRLDKIIRQIKGARLGIHDISRVTLNKNGYPRFNMPFELGLFFGASRFGNKKQKSKQALIFEKSKYSYQQSISDLNGVDTKAHNNSTEDVIKELRNWFLTLSPRSKYASHSKIKNEFNKLNALLPDLEFNDYCIAVEEYLELGSNY